MISADHRYSRVDSQEKRSEQTRSAPAVSRVDREERVEHGRSRRGKISVTDLAALIAAGEIDTVVTAVCDMQGRLIGKRVTGQFFVDHCLDHGTHLCTYLLGTDMEMNTPDGYALMNWETGYGDYLNRPDWATLRVVPWLEKTALVLGDVVDEATSQLVPVAPRSILRRQIERAERMGFRPMMASELEFYLLRDTYEEAAEKGWDGLRPWGWYNEDYQLLQATKAEPIYRQLRNQMVQAGVPIEFSKGEAAPGQHEVNIHYDRRTGIGRPGRHLQAWRQGDRPSQRVLDYLHGQTR